MKPYLFVLSAIIFFAAGCGKEERGDDDNNKHIAGDYHWKGSVDIRHAGQGTTTKSIDDTSAITRKGNSKILFRDKTFEHTTSGTPHFNVQRATFYFADTSLHFVGEVQFDKPFNDTAYYYSSEKGGQGSEKHTTLIGVKLH